MREIKTKPARSIFSREKRLSMLSIRKLQAGRSLLKIFSQQFAKLAARRDESIPVVHEMESIRTGFLFRRKRGLQSRKSFFIAVECRVPNVDFIPDRFPIHGGKMRRSAVGQASACLLFCCAFAKDDRLKPVLLA